MKRLTVADEAVDKDGFGLAEAVGAKDGLEVIGRVPRLVRQNHLTRAIKWAHQKWEDKATRASVGSTPNHADEDKKCKRPCRTLQGPF